MIPSTIEEAWSFDCINKNILGGKVLQKELKNVIVAFQLLEQDEPMLVGSKYINYHFIFYVKFDLTRKAWCVAGGHRNKSVPAQNTYVSVVSRDNVRLGSLIAALNDLDTLIGYIGNTYLNELSKEKIHVTIVDDMLFGPKHKCKMAVIVRAFYGLKL